MKNTPPPSFPMENKKEQDSFKQYVEKLTTPIFNKVLQEVKSDTMTTLKPFNFLWQPHNYRLKIPISYENLKINKVLFHEVKYIKRTNKYIIKDFKGLTTEINPTCLIVIYSSKKWYKLKGSMPEINAKLLYIINQIENKCIKKAKELAKVCNFTPDFDEKVWVRSENGIKGDEFLDKIDPKLIIHDTTFKKVYPDKIEFKSPFYLKNWINNRALEMVSPQIVDRLDRFTDAIELEIKNKQLHMKVLNNMDKSLIQISSTMKHLNNNILRVKYKGRRLSILERKLIGG